MKKFFLTVTVLLPLITGCYAQYGYIPMAPTNERVIYTVTKTVGNEADIKNIGNVGVQFKYDSIGKNWNMPTENDYLRFKILHFYILDHRKEGEHWKKLYSLSKTKLDKKFNDYMRSRLKKRKIKISSTFQNTEYVLNIYFVDKSTNVQHEDYYAVYQFVNNATGHVVVQYHIEPKKYNDLLDINPGKHNHKAPPPLAFIDLSIAMSNYFKKNLKD